MPMPRDYKSAYGDWSLVIGASEGLGEALANGLAGRGMNVAMVARGEARLRAAAGRVAEAHGVETLPIVADLARADVLDTLLAGLGGRPVGFVIFNAAAEFDGEFIKQDLERHLAQIQVNCIAPTVVMHHFGREMVAAGRGGLVLCSSLASAQGLYNWVSYGATKAFMHILGEGLWYELKDAGVDATTLMVGSTYTPNFQKSQAARNAPFARSRTPENLPDNVPVPQTPEDAAHHLFAQIDEEWLPLIYANPADAERASRKANVSRAELICQISDSMRESHQAFAQSQRG
jgi:uncharacterized protein